MGEYEPIERLGEGAFGEVWLEFDRALGINRAVKYVDESKLLDASNIYHEPQILRELKHDNIVEVVDAGPTDQGIYIAMEYLPRGSIESSCKGNIVPLRQAILWSIDICRAMEYVHGRKLVHRDIKPANVLIGEHSEGKLSDFGLATRVRAGNTASGHGYTAHLAPEVLTSGETSVLSDTYAIGVTIYRMVNGDALLPPIDSADLEDAILDGAFPDRKRYRPFIPQRLARVINRAMDPVPSKRFQSATDLRHALERLGLKCDWEQQPMMNGVRWSTRGLPSEFEITISGRNGRRDVEVTRGRPGAARRRAITHCTAGVPASEAEKLTRQLMARISETGAP